MIQMKGRGHFREKAEMRSQYYFVISKSFKNTMKGGCAIRAAISPTLLAEVMAIKNVVFMDRCKSLLGPVLLPIGITDDLSRFS